MEKSPRYTEAGRPGTGSRGRLAVLYHFYSPDEVISARHYQDFCEGMAARGWEVEVLPSNRSCRDPHRKFPLFERLNGVSVRRVWRPGLRQSSHVGRVVNAVWMLLAWSGLVFRQKKNLPDVVVVGTDPVLGVLAAIVIRAFRPSVKIAHWCFDLALEGAIAEKILPSKGFLTSVLRRAYGRAYRSCDVIADIGPCMKGLLEAYPTRALRVTRTPWALWEPASPPSGDAEERKKLFGEARLGLLYSGNFGFSHSYEELLRLARLLSGDASVRLCFGVSGNGVAELKRAVGPGDTNVSFAGYATEAELGKRLLSADIHVASLKDDRAGVVVPSKFFGSLAAGKPVLFAGPERSDIARWIREYDLGWVLGPDSMDEVAARLREIARDPAALAPYRQRCFRAYDDLFSKKRVLDLWQKDLEGLTPCPTK